MTTADGQSRPPSAGRPPVGQPGLRWAGDGALRPARPPAARAERAGPFVPGGEPRLAPSGHVIASFLRRGGGFVIDFLIISTIYALVLTLVFGDTEPADIGRVDSTWLPFVTTGMIVRLAYNWYFNSRGWSPGKRAWGLRLEGADGRPPTVMRSLVRALVAELSLFLWLGYLWAAWDRQGQTWHDRAAASWVVRAAERDEGTPGAPAD